MITYLRTLSITLQILCITVVLIDHMRGRPIVITLQVLAIGLNTERIPVLWLQICYITLPLEGTQEFMSHRGCSIRGQVVFEGKATQKCLVLDFPSDPDLCGLKFCYFQERDVRNGTEVNGM